MKCINNQPLEGNDVAPPLELGEEYQLSEIYTCECGQEHYNVELKSKYNYISCYNCKKELPAGGRIHWCHPSRFEK